MGTSPPLPADGAAVSPDRADTIATVWDQAGLPLEKVFHQTSTSFGNPERVAGFPSGVTTLFLRGDGKVVCRGPRAMDSRRCLGDLQDIAIDANGRCWTIERIKSWSCARMVSAEKRRTDSAGLAVGRAQGLGLRACRKRAVVVGCSNGYLRILGPDGKPVRDCACFDKSKAELLIERSTTIQAADISRDGSLAVAGTDEGRFWVYRLPSGEKLCDHTAHQGRITSVAFDPTGDWLATGGRDSSVCLWRRVGHGYSIYLSLDQRQNAPGSPGLVLSRW